MKSFASTVVAAAIAALAATTPAAHAAVFSDNFETGASALWGNEVGAWAAASGVYAATAPGNFPSAASSLPWTIDDFVVEFDVNGIDDGGAWLRSSNSAGSIGRVGVLMVMAGGNLYWHEVTDGSNYGASLSEVGGIFSPGQNAHFRVVVSGDEYKVYIDGDSSPASSLTTGAFANGRFALYDNSAQTFDNVVLTAAIPEPETFALMLAGLAVIGVAAWRRR